MKYDLHEYNTFREVTQKTENEEGIFIDNQRIKEILNRPEDYGKDAYWSFHKLGKSPSAFKSPFLQIKKPNENIFNEEAFWGEDYTFEELGEIDNKSLERPVGDIFKGPYWSLFNIGKSPGVFKDSKLKDDGTKINKNDQLKLEEFKTEEDI